ncbi:MAG TPA: phenylalanine--tRNA ligase subunit alpha [Thermoplasmata archaeon]|jgi:phenylalanyl-tRNA synthetase alpha chain|nr:phenylalanine--tRNA ligase subunit alpha [Thermoplasmata archaeon]
MPPEPEEPDEASAPTELSLGAPERAVLGALRAAGPVAVEEEALPALTSLSAEAVRGALQRLRSKGLAAVEEEHREELRVTVRGEQARSTGLPERRLLRALTTRTTPMGAEDVVSEGLEGEERSAAIGILRRRQFLADGIPFRLREGHPDPSVPFPEELALEVIGTDGPPPDARVVKDLRRRGLVDVDHRSMKRWRPSEEGARAVLVDDANLLGTLTTASLRDGSWQGREFRPYDVRAAVPYVTGARPHRYAAWLREFEEHLIGLGFEQAEGPILETEFWNSDVLFMPQHHPARSIHDVFGVVGVEGKLPPAELLDRVAAVHEGRPLPGEREAITPGWGAPYDPAVARRLVLRSQTTSVSARYLANRPASPFRMFCLDRNFRVEAVDATHHIDFTQCEGILGGEGISLRDLVGVFRELASAIGIRDLRIRPSYFPFTEPSVEGYVKHPRLGWIEIFPGGLFRPEVLRPLGVDVPVAAWGIGVMRLAMVSLGVSDIRELFEDDLDRLTGGPR